jgi:hypothetical protein
MSQPIKPVGTSPVKAQGSQQDPTAATRRLQNNTQYASRTGTAAYGAQLQPVADPNSKLVGFKTGFQDTGRICVGWIMDGTAIANCYRVHVEKSRAPIIATALTGTAQACFGASEINTYAPGTQVIVMVHDKVATGYILGAVPGVLDIGTRAYHDYITQTSRKRVDDCHKRYLKQPMSGMMVDWSNWRPWDATLGGEWGAITTTGMGVSLDDFMVKMSVNEFTGVFGFYHDSLLRVSGYNMQTWTGGHERDAYVDEGEYNDFQGYSPYPWEALGLLKPGTELVQEYEPNVYQCALGKPYYAHWENKHEYQQPYHRVQHFYGYLGQGGRTSVQAPPQGLDRWTYKKGSTQAPEKPYDSTIRSKDGGAQDCGGGEDKLTNHQDKPPVGLHEDNVAMDGRRFIASAKGIILAKRMLIPMPARLKRPEAGDGDRTDQNYKAASKVGSGPEHKITGDIKAEDTHKNMQRASGVLDLHAYLFNYAGIHPFYWHYKDYKVYEQSELEYAEYQHRVPDFTQLKGSMYLREPPPIQMEIDHRYGPQNFYETTAGISILEDGGIVISDGYGGEIKMSGGCLILSAPGDVWLKSGRHAQIWAGGDGIIRANGNVDVSTTEKHVRIKSEKNVLILAGNNAKGGDDGGVLIESRSKLITYDFEQPGDSIRFGGVVMRAPESNVVALAHQIYLRSGGGDSSFEPGNITIDAGKGEKDIVTKSNMIFNYVGQDGMIANFYGLADAGDPQVAHVFEKGYVLLSGELGVEKNIIAGEGLLTKDFIVTTGPIAAKPPFVGECSGDCEKDVNEAIDEIQKYIKDIMPRAANKFHDDYIAQLWYEDKRAGHARTMDIMEFSWRTDEQYKIPDFMLYEDRWQQMARLAGKIPNRWTEAAVKSKVAGETYPFPGKKWLEEPGAYRTQDFNLVESSGGNLRDKTRGAEGNLTGEYREPKFAQSKPEKINGQYPIVGNS